MNANELTAIIPRPEIKISRPEGRKFVTAGGRYYRQSNRIAIYGWMSETDAVYIIGHEMLHFILNTFEGGWSSTGLDNIAEFGSEL